MPPRTKRGRNAREQTPPPPEVESEEEESQLGATKAIASGFYLDVEDLGPVEGNLILGNLQYLGWLKFLKFCGPYYQGPIYQFYANMGEVSIHDNNPSISFDINGTKGSISAFDLFEHFDMPISYHEEDLIVLDYPKKGWSMNWPFEYEDCVRVLNNGRVGGRDGRPSKLNLTGYQRLALKLVFESLLPANNKASELTYVQTLLVMDIMKRERINLPSLIIKHMAHSASREILPYGMVLSHLFFKKNVNFGREIPMEIAANARINRNSLRAQEIYHWRNKWWSKWEVLEYFELELEAIWERNGLKHCPRIPTDFVRCGYNRGPPNSEVLAMEEDVESSRQYARNVLPRRRVTEREMLETMQTEMHSMQLELQRQSGLLDTIRQEQLNQSVKLNQMSSWQNSYVDYQWRQTAMFQAMSTHMGIRNTFDNLFAGFPTSAPHPSPQPSTLITLLIKQITSFIYYNS